MIKYKQVPSEGTVKASDISIYQTKPIIIGQSQTASKEYQIKLHDNRRQLLAKASGQTSSVQLKLSIGDNAKQREKSQKLKKIKC